jgi:S1-C subfamily serine protease
MEAEHNIWSLAEGMADGTLSDAERAMLEERLQADAAYRAAFEENMALIEGMRTQGRVEAFRATLRDVHTAAKAPVRVPVRRTISLLSAWKTVAVAASVAALISIAGVFTTGNRNKSSAQYSKLSREIEAVKRSQNQLINNQNRLISDLNSTRHTSPVAPVKTSGTGFALTANGYLVTAYHVAQDADSLYIQTRSGDYYKASLVAFDPQADVAVLKVDDKNFHFGHGDLPYSFAQKKAGLGSRIFTLGFPQDEVVYSEGYVSSRNGYNGDSAQYRLELPADPGASGAPVLDASGAVVAVVAGRNNQTAGTTYAISSKALLRLLASMPKDMQPIITGSNRLRGLAREQQLDKLQDYTCIVRVYKP